MLLPCEDTVKKYLPAIRAGLIKELSNEYRFDQIEIASKLGITQAAVSKYLHGNYTEKVKKLENSKEVRGAVKKLALSVVKGKVAKLTLANLICESCMNSVLCFRERTKR